MQRQEIRSLADLAGEGTRILTSFVRDTHSGIAERVFGAIGPASKPVEIVHNTLAAATYYAVDRGVRASLHGAGELAAEVRGSDEDDTVQSHPTVAGVVAALNGIYGDELTNRGNEFALTMQIRQRGKPVALDAAAVAAAFPEATGRIAVFVHGWCMTEMSWRRQPRDGEMALPYGTRLRSDLGFTPVYLRYNTGLHISDNGKALAALIDELRALWPVPVEEIALIGHSMGGLVARSACHYGVEQSQRWPDAVRHVVCLGSPHLGADLEKGVNAASWVLARLPETRAVSSFLNARSSGTKDLRYGALLDEDWSECDPDEFLRDRCHEVPFLPGAVYHFVASSAGPRAVGVVLGDRLVRPDSASGVGKSRQVPFDAAHGLTLTGLHHFDLLNHTAIYAKLHEWLGPSSGPTEVNG
ncbi:esterase/lipase family protein [Mycobacterium heidelbergense]|uniref:esterase/lipase family protein n=1 Tax=Mycobacterium heidelbergense TaxID=53376 RepID=UPI003CF2A7FF